jgi:tRNA(Ile)-lysidine synthase
MGSKPTDVFVNDILRSYSRLHVSKTRLLLAVSGGADSLALLLASAEIHRDLECQFFVASIDHGLRTEAAQEVQSVESLARSLELPFVSAALNLQEGPGLEERAREARYQALEALRRQTGCDWIVTAHTANDQAETLLMRLSRGASLKGAAGIREKSGHCLRPMLELSRPQVEAFLERRNAVPVQDPHNDDTRFYRVRMRRDALPALERAGEHPQVVRHLAKFAALAEEDEQFLGSLANAALTRLKRDSGWDAVGLRALELPIQRRALRAILELADVRCDHRTLEDAREALGNEGQATLSEGQLLRCQGGWVRIASTEQVPSSRGELTLEVRSQPATDQPSFPVRSELLHPVNARWAQSGDRVRLETGRHKKLQDVLVDSKVPRESRNAIAVVTDSTGDVIWIPGIWPKALGSGAGAPKAYLVLLHDKQGGERQAASL